MRRSDHRTQVPFDLTGEDKGTRPFQSSSTLHSATSARSSMVAPTGAREATAMTPDIAFPSVTRVIAKPTNVLTSCVSSTLCSRAAHARTVASSAPDKPTS